MKLGDIIVNEVNDNGHTVTVNRDVRHCKEQRRDKKRSQQNLKR